MGRETSGQYSESGKKKESSSGSEGLFGSEKLASTSGPAEVPTMSELGPKDRAASEVTSASHENPLTKEKVLELLPSARSPMEHYIVGSTPPGENGDIRSLLEKAKNPAERTDALRRLLTPIGIQEAQGDTLESAQALAKKVREQARSEKIGKGLISIMDADSQLDLSMDHGLDTFVEPANLDSQGQGAPEWRVRLVNAEGNDVTDPTMLGLLNLSKNASAYLTMENAATGNENPGAKVLKLKPEFTDAKPPEPLK